MEAPFPLPVEKPPANARTENFKSIEEFLMK
jgi:hypothetical protein